MPRTPVLLLAGVIALTACLEDEPARHDKNEFAQAAAEATCAWIFTCCDQAERDTMLGSRMDEGACVTTKRVELTTFVAGAADDLWNEEAAAVCSEEVAKAAAECPRAFSPTDTIDTCELVTRPKQPGDQCETSWDCTTMYCKNGVCANPLTKDSACTTDDRCETGLRCVAGTCAPLQPDGASCTDSSECMSGACGAGKCYVAATFTCDG